MRLIKVGVVVFGLALVGCRSHGTGSLAVRDHAQVYVARSGWSVKVPPGWHARQFRDSKNGIKSTGVQLSNIQLPRPRLDLGYPVQADGSAMRGGAIGLIIATDPDPRLQLNQVLRPPLPKPGGPYWSVGSAPAGAPYLETLWFRTHGITLIASAKIGPHVTDRELKVLASIIRSVR